MERSWDSALLEIKCPLSSSQFWIYTINSFPKNIQHTSYSSVTSVHVLKGTVSRSFHVWSCFGPLIIREAPFRVLTTGCRPPPTFLYAREGRWKSFERGNYPPPPRLDRRAFQPNHIKFRTCRALAPMWTSPMNEIAELIRESPQVNSVPWGLYENSRRYSLLILTTPVIKRENCRRQCKKSNSQKDFAAAVYSFEAPSLTLFCFLRWARNCVGSRSAHIQSVKFPQNMVSNTAQHPPPPPRCNWVPPPPHPLTECVSPLGPKGGGMGVTQWGDPIRTTGQEVCDLHMRYSYSVEGLYCKRPIQCMASSKILTPHPLTARRVWTPPPAFGAGGGQTRWVERGWEVNILEDAENQNKKSAT
jgi:hypothetical protein